MFNINLNIIVQWLLPPVMRGSTLIAFIQSLVAPLQNTHASLADFRALKQYELSITPQIIWLEQMLNQLFDPTNSLIYIEDIAETEQIWVNNRAENPHPRYLHNKSENEDPIFVINRIENAYGFNFCVYVPSSVYQGLLIDNNNGMSLMKAKINQYKMFGTRYIIKAY